jgi:hypothetical protein
MSGRKRLKKCGSACAGVFAAYGGVGGLAGFILARDHARARESDGPIQTSLGIFDLYYRDGSCYDVARIALEQRGLYRLIQCPS